MIQQTGRLKVHRTISLYLLYGIALTLPIHSRAVAGLIALLMLNWIAEGSWIKAIPGMFKERKRIWMISFSLLYIVYLAGLLWTTDFPYAWFDLQVKLSLLIFPLIFATTLYSLITEEMTGKLIRIFETGCIIISLVFYIHAAYNALINHVPGAFFYANLSWYFHPAYLAMYVSFVISNMLSRFLLNNKSQGFQKKSLQIILMIHLTVFIILLSSKAGLLSIILVILFYTVLLAWSYKKWEKAAIFFSCSVIVFIAGLMIFPNASTRVSQAAEDMSTDGSEGSSAQSTSERIIVWKVAVNIILKQPILGVGTGDVKDELLREYYAKKDYPAFNQKLNAHNQYLQTMVTLGITGFIVLAGIILSSLVISIKKQDYPYTAFILLIILNIAFESMFETQAGVVFYAFFNILLFCNMISVKEIAELQSK